MTETRAVINVDINTAGAAAELRRLQSQLNAFQSTLSSSNRVQSQAAKNLSLQLREAVNATQMFSAETVRMRTSAGRLDDALSKGKGSISQYFNSFRKGSTEAAQVMSLAHARASALQTQFVATGAAAGGYREALAIRPLSAFNATATVSAEKLGIQRAMLTQASTQMINFGKNTQWAGRQLMVGFTVPLTIFGTIAGKTYMELEKQAISFKKVYGDSFTTPQELQENLDAVKVLSEEYTKFGIAASKTMELAAQAAAMGAQGATLTDAITESTKLATLGQMEQTEALETTIALQNAFGLSGEKLAKSVNFLNMVENQTVLTLQDLAEAIPRVSPVIKGLGGTVEDMAAMLAAMKEGGVSAAQGANALKSGLASLINPTDKAVERLKEMGINLETIIRVNRGDLLGTVQAFGKALSTLDEFGRQQALEKVFGKYQYARLGALFNNIVKDGTQASRVLDMASMSAKELNDVAEKELKVISDSPATRMTAAIEKLKLSIAPLGEMFIKFAIPVVELFTRILKIFDGLPDGVKKIGAIGAIIVGVVIPAGTMFLGLLLNLMGTLVKFGHIVGVTFKGLLTGGLSGAVSAVSQSLKYMSLAEIDAAGASMQLGESTLFVNAALKGQISASDGANVAIVRLAESYAVLRAQMQMTAGASPTMFGIGNSAAVAASSAPSRAVPRRLRRNSGGSIPYLSNGNTVPGSGNTDTVPAMLTPGEFVINKKATEKNLPLLYAINDGNTPPGFNRGGQIPGVQYAGIGNIISKIFGSKPKPPKPLSAYDTPPTEEETARILANWPQRPVRPMAYQSQAVATAGKSKGIYGDLTEKYLPGTNSKVDTLRFMVDKLGFSPAALGLQSHGNFVLGFSKSTNLAMAGKNPTLTRERLLAELVDSNGQVRRGVYSPLEQQMSSYFRNGQAFDHDLFDNIFRGQVALSKEPISNKRFEKISRNALREYLRARDYSGPDSRSFIKDILSKDTVRGNASKTAILSSLTARGIPYETNGKDVIATIDGVRYNFGSVAGREMGSLGRPEGIRPYGDLEMSPGAERVHANKGGMIPGLQFFGWNPALGILNKRRIVQPRPLKVSRSALGLLTDQGILGGTRTATTKTGSKGKPKLRARADAPSPVSGIKEELFSEKIGSFGMDEDILLKQLARIAGLDETEEKVLKSSKARTIAAAHIERETKMREDEIEEKVWKAKNTRFTSSLENDALNDIFGSWQRSEVEKEGFGSAALLKRTAPSDVDSSIIADILNGKHPSSPQEYEVLKSWMQNIKKSDKFDKLSPSNRAKIKLLLAFSDIRLGTKEKEILGLEDPRGVFTGNVQTLEDIIKQSGISKNKGGMIPGVPGLSKGALFLGMPHPFKSLTRSNEIKETLARTNISAQSGRSLDFPLMQTGSMVSGLGGRSSNIPGINGIYDMSDGRHVIKVHDTLESALAEARSSSLMRNVFGLESPQQEVIRVPHPDTGDLVFAVRSKYDEAFAQTTGSFEKESFSKQLIASLIRRDSDLSAENVYGNKVADVGAAIFGMDGSGKPRASMPRIIGEDPISVLEQLDINMLMKSGGGAKKHFAESTADIARSMTESEYVSSMKATISRARLNAEEAGSYLPGMSQLEKARYLKTLNNDFDNLDTVDWAEVYKHHIGIYPATKRPPTPASLKKKEEERVLRARQAGHNSPMINGMSFVNGGGMIPGMQYAIGGVVNQDRPFYGKYDQLTKALYSKWVGAQSSEIAAIKTGVGSDPAMAMAYGKGFRRSKEAMDLERSLFIRNNDLPKIGDEIELGNLSSFAAGGKDTVKFLHNSDLQKNAEFKGNQLLGQAQKKLWEAAKRRRRILAGKIIPADRSYNMPYMKPGDVPGPRQGVQGLLDDLDQQIKTYRASVKEYKAVVRDYKDHAPVIYKMHTPKGTPMANIDDIVSAENQTLWSGAGKSMAQVSEGERILHQAKASVIGISTRKLSNGREATVIELRLNPSSAQYPQFRADGGQIFESGPSKKIVPGVGNTDTVPAMLTPGEFVINKKATSENMALLHSINNGSTQAYAKGGIARYARGGLIEIGQDTKGLTLYKNETGEIVYGNDKRPAPGRIPAGLQTPDPSGPRPRRFAGMGMQASMGMGTIGGAMMMAPMIPGIGENAALSGALSIGGTALSAASVLPMLGGMLPATAAAALAGIAPVAIPLIATIGAVTAAFVVWRRNVDESARASAELGANMGKTSNALNVMGKLLGQQTPAQRSMQLQMGVSSKETEILQSPEMQGVLSSEEGQKIVTDLKDATSGERFKKLSDYLKSAIAAGMMDKTQASSFAKAIGMQLGDVVLGTSVSSSIRNQKTGSGALLALAEERKAAQGTLEAKPGSDNSSKIIGGGLQVIQDFSNAEALAREEFSSGKINFEEMNKVVQDSRETQKLYTQAIEDALKATSDFGGTMQATKDQLLKMGVSEEQYAALEKSATSVQAVAGYSRGGIPATLNKELFAGASAAVAGGMNVDIATKIVDEISNKSGSLFDSYTSAIASGLDQKTAIETAGATEQLTGKDGIIKEEVKRAIITLPNGKTIGKEITSSSKQEAESLLNNFVKEGGSAPELNAYLGGISEGNRNKTVSFMNGLKSQEARQAMVSDSQNLAQSIDQPMIEKLQMSDAYKKGLSTQGGTKTINTAITKAKEAGVSENVLNYAINTKSNGEDATPEALAGKINELRISAEAINQLPEEMLIGLDIDITDPKDLEKYGPMVKQLQGYTKILENLNPNIDMIASMKFLTMGNDGELLDPEQVAKNTIILNKAWNNLSSKNKNTRLQAVRQLLISTQDENGNQLDPDQVDASYNDLVDKFGGKIMNLEPDIINKLVSLQIEIEGIDESIAALKAAQVLTSPDQAERIQTQIDVLQAAKKTKLAAQRVAISTPSTGGGGGGGGGEKSIPQQLKEQAKESQEMFSNISNLQNAKGFKKFIAGPFAPEFLEYLRSQGAAGLKLIKGGLEKVKAAYADYQKSKISEGAAMAALTPQALVQESKKIALSSQYNKKLAGQGLTGEDVDGIRQQVTDEDLLSKKILERKKKNGTITTKERAELRAYKREQKAAERDVPIINQAQKFSQATIDMTTETTLLNAQLGLINEGKTPELAAAMAAAGLKAGDATGKLELFTDAYNKLKAAQYATDPGKLEQDKRDNAAEIRDINRQIDEINLIRPLEDQVEVQQKIIDGQEKIVRGKQQEIDVIGRGIELKQRELEPLDDQIEKLQELSDKTSEAYDNQIEALDQIYKREDNIAKLKQGQLGVAQALSRGDVAGAAQGALGMSQEIAQQSREEARSALEAQKEAATKNIQDQILAIEKQKKAINKEIEDLQMKQRVIQDDIYRIQSTLILPAENEIYRLQGEINIAADLLAGKYKNAAEEMANLVNQLRLANAEKAILDGTPQPLTNTNSAAPAEAASPGLSQSGMMTTLSTKPVTVQAAAASAIKTAASAIGAKATASAAAATAAARAKDKEKAAKKKTFGGLMSYNIGGMMEGYNTGGNIGYRGSKEPPPVMMNYGGMMKKYAYGSMVPGMGMTDKVPALLTPGEFVIRKSVVESYGPMLSNLNSQVFPKMNMTSAMPSTEGNENEGTVYNYQVSVALNGSNLDPNDVANAVMQKIKMSESRNIRSNNIRG